VDNSNPLSFEGMVLILMGFAMALWGLLLLYKPASLHPGSCMYRYIYYRFFAWRRKDMENSPKLTDVTDRAIMGHAKPPCVGHLWSPDVGQAESPGVYHPTSPCIDQA
jgi:hypothetical protein